MAVSLKSSEKEKHSGKFTYDIKFELEKIIPGGCVSEGQLCSLRKSTKIGNHLFSAQ